jgi:hypothetical protein
MTGTPTRVQMTRRRPWRADHPDAVIVDRRSPFGNPFRVVRAAGGLWTVDGLRGRSWPARAAASVVAVDLFVEQVLPGLDVAALRGRDVACWCPAREAGSRCPKCRGGRWWIGYDASGVDFPPCPACEGTGLARHPCHGDPLMLAANPGTRFWWADE